MAKAGVFVNVVGKVDAAGFARAQRELKALERQSTTSGQRIANSFKNAGSSLNSFGSKASRAGGQLTTGATLPILGAGVASFKFASDLNESMSKANVVFGKNAASIEKWASGAATSIGLSKQEALEAAGTLGNLFKSMDLGTGPASKMSTKIVGLAGDLASFNNANPADVLEALRSGLVGEAEPLRKFGVNINAARIEAEALKLGLAKAPIDMAKVQVATSSLERAQLSYTKALKEHGAESTEARAAAAKVAAAEAAVGKSLKGSKVELTAAQKAQATYSLIMRDTKLAQGDFARTSDGAANQTRILTARAKDAAASFGTQLLPIGLKVLDWASKLLDGFSNMSPKMQKIVLIAGGVVAALGPVLKVFGNLTRALGGTISAGGKVLSWLFKVPIAADGTAAAGSRIGLAFGKIKAAFVALKAVMVAHPFIAIATVVVALGVALFTLYKKNERFRRLVDAAWKKIHGAITAAWGAIRPVLNAFGRFVRDKVAPAIATGLRFVKRIFDIYTAPIRFVWKAVGDDLMRIIRVALNFISNTLRNTFNFWRGLFDFFINLVRGRWGAAWDGLKRAVGAMFAQLRNIVGSGFRVLRSLFGAGLSLVGRILSNSLRFMGRMALTLLGKIIGYFKALPGRIVNGLGNIGALIWNGVKTGFNNMKSNIGRVVTGVLDFFRKLPGRIRDLIPKLAAAGLDIGGRIIGGIAKGLGAIGSTAKEFAGDAIRAITDAAKGIVNSVIDAINDMIPNSIGKVKVAGKTIFPGLNLPDNPIPHLARGAVISRPTLALVGENPRTTPEIVSPERLLRRIVRDESGRARTTSTGATIAKGAIQFHVTIQGNPSPDELLETLEAYGEQMLGDLQRMLTQGSALPAS